MRNWSAEFQCFRAISTRSEAKRKTSYTHIGFEEDKKLAADLGADGLVDIIIGGHSHTKLDEPFVVEGIPIVQAAVGTDQIGRFDILFDRLHRRIDSYTWESIPVTEERCPHDEAASRFIIALLEGQKFSTKLNDEAYRNEDNYYDCITDQEPLNKEKTLLLYHADDDVYEMLKDNEEDYYPEEILNMELPDGCYAITAIGTK